MRNHKFFNSDKNPNDVVDCRYDIEAVVIAAGNPNADPETGEPRINPETSHGFMTDVCIKRIWRNCYKDMFGESEGKRIFVKHGKNKEVVVKEFLSKKGIEPEVPSSSKKSKSDNKGEAEGSEGGKVKKVYGQSALEALTKGFADLRNFGDPLAIGLGLDAVRGAIQFAPHADSVFPIDAPMHVTITTCQGAKASDKEQNIGEKWDVGEAVYRISASINPYVAMTNGVTEGDLQDFLNVFLNMFEHCASASRRFELLQLAVFKHENKEGVCRPSRLRDLIKVELKDGEQAFGPELHKKLRITFDKDNVPEGIEYEIAE